MKKAKPGRYARGRQFSRIAGEAIQNDAGYLHYLEQIDWREIPRIEQRKLAAIERLEIAGIPARTILAEHPGGSMLRDHVLNRDGHEHDSAIGLAARICELCLRLQELPKLGASTDMLIADAYRLGRLATLADAYEIQARGAKGARDKRAKDPFTQDEKDNALRVAQSMRRANVSDREIAQRLAVDLSDVPSETIRGWLKKLPRTG